MEKLMMGTFYSSSYYANNGHFAILTREIFDEENAIIDSNYA